MSWTPILEELPAHVVHRGHLKAISVEGCPCSPNGYGSYFSRHAPWCDALHYMVGCERLTCKKCGTDFYVQANVFPIGYF